MPVSQHDKSSQLDTLLKLAMKLDDAAFTAAHLTEEFSENNLLVPAGSRLNRCFHLIDQVAAIKRQLIEETSRVSLRPDMRAEAWALVRSRLLEASR